jgi:thiol-disulfide isomerase/thioredoxin
VRADLEVEPHGSRQQELSVRAAPRASAALLVVAALAFAACGGGDAAIGGAAGPRTPERAAVPRPLPEPVAALPFVDDDYPRALAEAKRTKRPLFVDAWAPWCHSCQSMRAFVMTDPLLAPLAPDFVWLSVDTEKESNAAFVERFPNRVWPTLWVIDAADETPTLRWEGTATAPELLTLLATVREGGSPGAAATTMTFLRANQAAARGELAEAERGYRAALAEKNFAERPRAVEALVGLLASRKDLGACTDVAVAEEGRLPPGTSRATVLAMGLACARDAKREADLRRLFEAARRVATEPDEGTLADDRSALFEELVETKKEQGDDAGARALAEAWASFLEREASGARTHQARAVFDPHRLSAYIAAGHPERAVAMLIESERDFPDDYNPPARLALAYLAAKRLDEAKAAIDRAASRVYGPRSLRVFALAADVARARGDLASERAALEQALARTSRAVLNDNQKRLRASLEQRLHDLPP